jgi:hypothetical protein
MFAGFEATLEARFFSYNMDGQAKTEALPNGFVTNRPMAHIEGRFIGNSPVAVSQSVLPIAPDRQDKYPFVNANLPAAQKNWLVTVLCAGSNDIKAAGGRIQTASDNFGAAIVVTLNRDDEDIMIILRPEADDPTFFTVEQV